MYHNTDVCKSDFIFEVSEGILSEAAAGVVYEVMGEVG
jgi:hypothetical protein